MLISGATCTAVGIFLMSFLSIGDGYLCVLPGMVVAGLGIGLFLSAVVTIAVTALDPSHASLAGGIVYMCQVAAGSLGLGINTAIVQSASSVFATPFWSMPCWDWQR